LLVILALAISPLLMVALLLYRQIETNVTQQARAQLNALSALKQQQISLWANQRVSDLNNLATAPDIIETAQNQALPNLITRFNTFVSANPDFRALLAVNAVGEVVAASDEGLSMIGTSLQAEDFWVRARFEPFFATPRYDPRMNERSVSLFVAAPVIVAQQGTLAVLLGVLDDTPLLKIIVPVPGLGATGQAYVITADGYQLGATLTAQRPSIGTVGITRAITNKRDGSDTYLNREGDEVFGHYAWVNDFQIALLVEQNSAEALAPLRQATNLLLIILLLAGVVSVVVGVIFTRRLTQPIEALTNSVSRLASGDLSARVNLNRTDELGLLGNAFNQMSEDLRVSYRTLQTTAEARARQLAVTAEMSRATAASNGQDALFARVADLIQRHFNYDYVFIFTLDESGQTVHLTEAADSGVGQALKNSNYRVPVGATSIVGWVAENKVPRVSGQVRDDALYLPNPKLSDVQSEAAFPLLVSDRVIGVLDLQSRTPNAFAAPDIEVLQTAADQLAVATENNRLFTRQQRVLQLEDLVISLTGKIHQTLDPQNILESAALELGRAFAARRAVVRLYKPGTTGSLNPELAPPAEPESQPHPNGGNGSVNGDAA
jgi:HAMP domain-containing protein